eukprot:255421-Rhodomonas_salina.2
MECPIPPDACTMEHLVSRCEISPYRSMHVLRNVQYWLREAQVCTYPRIALCMRSEQYYSGL